MKNLGLVEVMNEQLSMIIACNLTILSAEVGGSVCRITHLSEDERSVITLTYRNGEWDYEEEEVEMR